MRFQKVLQGQEISGFDTPFDGIGIQGQHPSEKRRGFPGSNCSGIAGMGNSVRNLHVNSDNITSNGIGFGESFRFHKVLQGQEIHPSSPRGRAPTSNEDNEYGGLGIFHRVQVPSSRNGWSTVMQSNTAPVRTSAQSVQVSSPSSVLMFQQASAVSKFNSMPSNHNKEERRTTNRSSYVPQSYDGKFMPFPFTASGFGVEDHGGMKSVYSSTDRNQHGISYPVTAHPAFRSSQDVASSCKSSCRLFGFSLTEEKNLPNNKKSSTPAASSLSPGVSLFPNGGHMHTKPPLMTKPVGSNCTKVSDFYAVKDALFDIAL